MALSVSTRLCGRNLLGCHILRNISVYQSRQFPLQSRPATEPIEEGHDERNMRLCRPLSPHMTIYKFQLPAILSISHRITGLMLSGYAGTFAVVSLLSSKSMGDIVQNISHCYPQFFLIFKVGLIVPFAYHFFNGIRHLIWDTGKALTLKGVYISGYTMLLFAFSSIGALFYLAEEQKRLERERKEKERRRKEAELAAKKAAEEAEKNQKNKKKKKK